MKVLSTLGVKVLSSCEGHIGTKGKSRRPWVNYYDLMGWTTKALQPIMDEFNHISTIKWESPGMVRTIKKARSRAELISLQESAETFAEYLFEKYIKQK